MQQSEVKQKKESEKLEKALQPKQILNDLKAQAMTILPLIVNTRKDSDKGLINVSEMRKQLRLPLNKAYDLRKELLKELHYNDDKLLNKLRRTNNANR